MSYFNILLAMNPKMRQALEDKWKTKNQRRILMFMTRFLTILMILGVISAIYITIKGFGLI